MTKLLKTHREAITTRLLATTFAERELRLKQQEHALGLRLLRAQYSDRDLRLMASLPEGWLPLSSQLGVKANNYQRTIALSDPVRLPATHPYVFNIDDAPAFRDEIEAHFAARQAMRTERNQLSCEIAGTLSAFITVEKLAEGWPEGYAHFPHGELAPVALPALRIEDLNARLAAAREAA